MCGRNNWRLTVNMKILIWFLCAIMRARLATATLTLDENFDNLNSWNTVVQGSTSRAFLAPSTFNGTTNMLSTNVTYCGAGLCYEADISLKEVLHEQVIPTTSGKLFLQYKSMEMHLDSS
jgi:hypothetical protein